MVNPIPHDKSNGYEQIAQTFMRARNPRIGPATVRQWSKTLPRGIAILDLGCGYGVPISQALIDEGFAVWGVDASPSLLAAFRVRFPNAPAECAAAEESEFFRRTFDAIVAWGLMFLLPPEAQTTVIKKAAKALTPGARFLFTSQARPIAWSDSLTGRTSISLGRERYEEILRAEGLRLAGEDVDEGENHYYFVLKPEADATRDGANASR
ncbi:Methyltransferase type 11 [Acidobacteriia bacterium SbA2]|nr:Methyltransferase type 11 [Acidobacteriia bacterium SbA2]